MTRIARMKGERQLRMTIDWGVQIGLGMPQTEWMMQIARMKGERQLRGDRPLCLSEHSLIH